MGFEPTVRYERTHAFQACSLNHSDTSPLPASSGVVTRKARLLALTRAKSNGESAYFTYGSPCTIRATTNGSGSGCM